MKDTTIRYSIAFNIKRLMSVTIDARTETDLAVRTQIPQSTIQSILCGAFDVDVDTLDVIAKTLNVSADALLASPSTPVDPISKYRDWIAALPADQQQRIQAFIDSIPAMHEEEATH